MRLEWSSLSCSTRLQHKWREYRRFLMYESSNFHRALYENCQKRYQSSSHYLHDLITVKPSRSTWSFTLVTLLQLPVHSSSRSQTALFGMLHLTCGTSRSFLLLFVFLTNLVYHHPALCLQALVLGWLLTFLMTFFTRAVVEYSNIQIPK